MNAIPHIDTVTGWLVVYTEPRAEKRAKWGIQDSGMEVFAPVEKQRPKKTAKTQTPIERPVFSRYIFARERDHMQHCWAELNGIDGIVDVLTNNDIPSRVPATWVEALRKAEAYGVFDRTHNAPQPFEINEVVRVSDGPFSGHNVLIAEFIAKLKSTTAKKRVRVLMDFMGRQTPMEFDVCDLEKL